MTRASLVALLLMSAACTAMGQTDIIALYSDQAYTNCNLADGSPQVVTVYVVHESNSGVMACQFIIKAGTGVGLTYLGETSPQPAVIGDTQSGMSVAYGNCQYQTVLIASISYFTTGTSSPCAKIRVVPDPNSPTGTIEVVDCSYYRGEGLGGRMVINPDGSCSCGPDGEMTSWGRIKSQYQD